MREFEGVAASEESPANPKGPVATEILRVLVDGPRTLEHLASRLALTLPVVTRHVGAHVEAGVVERRRVNWRTEEVALKDPVA